jgi:oxygen-dependent protoporphyrinogen oxidase
VIQSIRQDGYLAEYGPNTILETSPKISALVRDLGLEERRLYSDPQAEKRFLVRGGKLIDLPGSPRAFLSTPLFSAMAKLRLLAEPFICRAPAGREESIAEFVLRRIGREFLDFAINPLVAGVYAGDPARLSVKHAFPRLHALEQKYGSLILGQILGARERKRRSEAPKQNAKKLSFDEGLQVIIDALRLALGESVRLRSPVACIEQADDGWALTVRADRQETRRQYAAVLFAGTSCALADLELKTELAIDLSSLKQIHCPPIASVVLGFRREDVAHPLDGFGVLVPQVEGLKILGTLFSSSLFLNRAPAGHVTLTTYIGGRRNPELALLDTESLVDLTRRDLRRLLGVTAQPTFEHHVLFRRAIPQYEVGYGRFKNLMDEAEIKASGLFLAGHYRNGVSLGDSLVAGHDVAERMERFLRRRKPMEKGKQSNLK